MNKKLILLLIVLFCGQFAFSQPSNVKVFDKVTIVTDPSQGVKSFVNWGKFPSASENVRRVVMNLTLAYPEDRAIAHWDYMDRVKILRQGGKNGKAVNFEIGRMLTPYGSNFKEGWSFTWSIDVTDFQTFLRDSVELEYIHSGYESPELGWDLSIDFDITYGPQVADFITVQKMWDGNYQYGNPANNIETQLTPIKVKTAKNAAFGRFRIQHTGHGMDEPSGCSEFCSRWRELVFDDQVVDHRDMWKDCGNNPLYPQGGTWIFDRAYWCPGDLQVPDVIDIQLSKSKHTLDLNMEPLTANNIDQPKEQITSYFFQYGEPNHTNDVIIEEIIAPNSKDNYNRFNPRGFSPIIKIRNLGKQDLTSLDIVYKTVGFAEKTYKWEGNLGFYEGAVITLPGEIDANPGTNTFAVTLTDPNGVADEWDADNSLEASFEDIPKIPSTFVVDFMTNNRPKDNSLYIVNSEYDTVYAKTPEMLDSATTYLDTIQLPEGNYYMQLVDTAGDGLEFWFLAQAGYGRLRLKDTEGNLVHLFESDCGNGQFYAFRADNETKVDPSVPHLSVNIYPRMVRDYATVYTTTNKPSTLKIRITKDGGYIETHEFTNIKDAQTGLDLRHLEEGRYVMEIYVDGEHKMNRRFNKVPERGRRR
ncbi:peptide-N-glycosidase F-related protein [Maribellus sp. YY47]|uniref:peptide-N-glycosidase F-related protein n=1 Tax=Maribellus sp. YY47 TaxID=2929486 RepID=UPI0020009713|nr:peptide-N-glycosidase F-related protein [Maribellus sp. YY47]MCK3683530.1 peptide-N-glycosidase [Maribellus sp. YY47]